MIQPYFIELPAAGVKRLPIVVSVPHCGSEVPPAVAQTMHPKVASTTPDTDWFVHELYAFAPKMGVTLIHARYSRLVIDLNRDPAGLKLYTDGRRETQLVPLQTFAGDSVYRSPPDEAEIKMRLAAYYRPYHERIDSLLHEFLQTNRHVLFWDAHSIKRHVPSVRAEAFADMILGDQNGNTAAASLSETARRILGQDRYELAYNTPFMGGYLTRSKGKPKDRIHALQLEMSQDVYMNEDLGQRDASKAALIQTVLEKTLLELAGELARLA